MHNKTLSSQRETVVEFNSKCVINACGRGESRYVRGSDAFGSFLFDKTEKVMCG